MRLVGIQIIGSVLLLLTMAHLAPSVHADSILITSGSLGGRIPSDFATNFTLFGEDFSMMARAGGFPNENGVVVWGNRSM
jgi:hypothetical protein